MNFLYVLELIGKPFSWLLFMLFLHSLTHNELSFTLEWVSLLAQIVKNLPSMWETQVQSLGREDPPGEGNGYPLQYSCLETPTDRDAYWLISFLELQPRGLATGPSQAKSPFLSEAPLSVTVPLCQSQSVFMGHCAHSLEMKVYPGNLRALRYLKALTSTSVFLSKCFFSFPMRISSFDPASFCGLYTKICLHRELRLKLQYFGHLM